MRYYLKYVVCSIGILISVCGTAQQLPDEASRIAKIETSLQLLSVELSGLSEKVNVNISNTSLTNFVKAIAKVHRLNINCSEALNTITIANGFNDVVVQDLLLFLVKEYQLDLQHTGNIISIKKYTPPVTPPVVKEIIVSYDVVAQTVSFDLNNDPLSRVFRKLSDLSGKNMVYNPEIQSNPLSLYLTNVPFDMALQKLAETNALRYRKTKNGFYEFRAIANRNSGGVSSYDPYQENTGYTVLDTLQKTLSLNVQQASAAQLIHSLAKDFRVDVFTASPLDQLGTITMKAKRIHFDALLTTIVENTRTVSNTTSNTTSNTQDYNDNRQSNSTNTSADTGTAFTFKKEGTVYYFGTENQLTLKQIELVQMMHRSIATLGDANAVTAGGNTNGNFVTGGTNFFGDTRNNGISNPNGFTNNRSGSSFQSGFSNTRSTGNNTPVGNIAQIFPASVTEGLDIKIDTELNSFVVSGPGARVAQFKKFVSYIDKPVPLILLEVMILEVSRNATVEAGLEFGLGSEPRTTEGVTFPNADITLGAETVNRIIGGFDGFGSLNLGNVLPNFYMDIKAMETSGNVKILSTPKLSTLNGHKAYLSSGQTTYYAVTSQNIFGSQNPQTSEIVNYQPINAELALEFKPFVSGDGQITLDIQVIQSSFNGRRIAEDAPPDINSRSFSSIMRMQTNDVAILGGIEEKVKNDTGTGVPLLSRIPILKWLFSSRRREDTKRKLNVIIKPTVFY